MIPNESEWRKLYATVLRSARWRNMRAGLVKLTDGCCERCQLKAVGLELHHVTYERLGREQRADVQLLCPDCHRLADAERVQLQYNASERRQTKAAMRTYFDKTFGEDYEPDDRDVEMFHDWLERKRNNERYD